MSVYDQAAASVLTQLALAADGAVLGFAVTVFAVRTVLKYKATSSSLGKIKKAPSVGVSDLRSVLSSPDDDASSSCSSGESDGGKLVIVRGVVEAKSALDPAIWKGSRSNVLVSHESGEKGVVLQRTQSCIYYEWRGMFGWNSTLRSLLAKSWREQASSSIRTVPFILVQDGKSPQSSYVAVNMNGSNHSLPLTTVYHQVQPVNPSPYTFLQALFGYGYPVGLVDEEKILPLEKNITAVGMCSLKNGIPEIKSSKALPYFLSDMTKDQLVIDLSIKTKVLFWGSVGLGSLAIGILGYAAIRNWSRWKEWRRHQQSQRTSQHDNSSATRGTETEVAQVEDTSDVPDGELCVVCLMRRRRSAFIPCGHLVCCQPCALSVERESVPKCPVCRQRICSSVRIYDS